MRAVRRGRKWKKRASPGGGSVCACSCVGRLVETLWGLSVTCGLQEGHESEVVCAQAVGVRDPQNKMARREDGDSLVRVCISRFSCFLSFSINFGISNHTPGIGLRGRHTAPALLAFILHNESTQTYMNTATTLSFLCVFGDSGWDPPLSMVEASRRSKQAPSDDSCGGGRAVDDHLRCCWYCSPSFSMGKVVLIGGWVGGGRLLSRGRPPSPPRTPRTWSLESVTKMGGGEEKIT